MKMRNIERYNKITKDLLLHYGKENGNIVLSPFSILTLLCMAADSTDTMTKAEIVKVICDNIDYNDFRHFMIELAGQLSKNGSTPKSANALYVNETIGESIRSDYLKMLSSDYDAKMFASGNIVEDINSWVREKTDGMIDKIIDGSKKKDLLACLINAICFESEWQEPYETNDISEDEFHNADGTTSEVKMLSSSENEYISDDTFEGFVKSYKGNEYSFMALLPKGDQSRSISDSLKQIDFSGLFENRKRQDVIVDMPEFTYDFSEDLSEYLQSLGIEKIFTPEADFSPMADEWIKADGIIHKVHIELDRKGTKAAAVTMISAVYGSAYVFETPYICLNRPFVYAIMHNDSGLPVFVGITNEL